MLELNLANKNFSIFYASSFRVPYFAVKKHKTTHNSPKKCFTISLGLLIKTHFHILLLPSIILEEKNGWEVTNATVVNLLPFKFIFQIFILIKFCRWEILWYFAPIIFHRKNKYPQNLGNIIQAKINPQLW